MIFFLFLHVFHELVGETYVFLCVFREFLRETHAFHFNYFSELWGWAWAPRAPCGHDLVTSYKCSDGFTHDTSRHPSRRANTWAFPRVLKIDTKHVRENVFGAFVPRDDLQQRVLHMASQNDCVPRSS